MRFMLASFIRFARCTRAVAAAEFAFILPVLLLLLFGAVEISRMVIIHQKLDKTVDSLADIITRSRSVTRNDLNNMAVAAEEILKPYPLTNSNGSVIFSSVVNRTTANPPCAGAGPCVSWQHKLFNTSTASTVGTDGGSATLPNGYTLPVDQNVIVAEFFYDFAPMASATARLIPAMQARRIHKVAMYKPRTDTLEDISAGNAANR